MNKPILEEIIDLLEAVSKKMKSEMQKQIVQEKLKPGNDLFIKTTVPELTISVSGVQVPRKSKEWGVKESWLRGNLVQSIEKVRKSEEFDELGTYLSKLSEKELHLI